MVGVDTVLTVVMSVTAEAIVVLCREVAPWPLHHVPCGAAVPLPIGSADREDLG